MRRRRTRRDLMERNFEGFSRFQAFAIGEIWELELLGVRLGKKRKVVSFSSKPLARKLITIM